MSLRCFRRHGSCIGWSTCSRCVPNSGWRGKSLPCTGQLALSISECLTGRLKPPLQLCNLPVAGGQVVCCPRQLSLKLSPLLGCLALEFSLLSCQALPLRTKVGKIRLSGCLRVTHLLETLLNLRELCSPR
jgi:hypothetical protein